MTSQCGRRLPYSGAQPVGKGWDTKRRHAQPAATTR